ncbi:TolC family outer membrane protein [uncultured Sphingomonas sp.]|uniref:TolC family outer membrane protein n=1 Tax=uncultured Sphingomonas sp. TaxID=158754 RepID=UPI0035C9AC83
MNSPVLAAVLAALLAAGHASAQASGPAPTETLADAVRAAVASNPALAAARDRQDALAETPEQARAAGRLTAEADATGGYDRFDYGKGGVATVSAALPIWTGGRVSTAVRAANGDVEAGAQTLRDTAADVIEQVVGAYAAVQFQQQAVAIARADIALLDSQVAEAKARFDLGAGTQTDVVRLVAEREGAVATLAAAEAALVAAGASFRAVVGRDPGALAPPPADLAELPASLDEARRRSVAANPAYLASLAARGAAAARIGVARANGAPSVTLAGGYGYGLAFGRDPSGYPASAAAGVTLRVPIFTGGLVASQVRQAQAGSRAAAHDADGAAREAIRAADTAWANVVAAHVRVAAGERAVVAADRALAGVKAEYVVALRTTLDILIADESLRGAQLALASSRSDLLTGEAALLRAVGSLDRTAIT